MSAIDLDQSISEVAVKSCNGTLVHVSRGLCCVAFRVPNNVRTNFVLIYFKQASASNNSVNFPILKKVSVCPILGVLMKGALNASPKVPEPLASGTSTLYLSQ